MNLIKEFPVAFSLAEKHFIDCLPNEGVGLILKTDEFFPLKNDSPYPDVSTKVSEMPDPRIIADAVCIVHSHPNESPLPGEADKHAQATWMIPFGIYSVSEDEWKLFGNE